MLKPRGELCLAFCGVALLGLACGQIPEDDMALPVGAAGAGPGGVLELGGAGAPGAQGQPPGSGGAASGAQTAGAGAMMGAGVPGGGPEQLAAGAAAQGGAGALDGAGGAGALDTEAAAEARPSLAARLSKAEYAVSVLDVLGVTPTPAELDAASGGIPDDSGDGLFKHFADKQTSIEQHASAYFEVGEAVALRTDVLALATEFGTCTEPTVACGDAFLAEVGARLFRRPLDEREMTTFAPVFAESLAADLGFEAAARWTIAALLQAPQFLFRLEQETEGAAGQYRDASSVEMAARLAAFLWLSVPDAELRAAAARGELSSAAQVQAQVTRMLADPKARRFTEAFVGDFSRARLASFEGVTPQLRDALHASVVDTFQHHLWDAQRSLATLYTTTEFVVNGPVAELLGVTAPAAGGVLDVSNLPERVGLLSHPGVIAGMGDRGTGSFVNRGKVLMERLLCETPYAVPAELLTELETFNADTTGLNEHERAAIRKTRAECWGCHTQFEPLAFGFSRFDGAGRYLGETYPDGKPLDLAGWVPKGTEADSPQYNNFKEYMDLLASDPDVQACMTEHFLAFATARSTDDIAKAQTDEVGGAYASAGSTLPAMVQAVAQSPVFRGLIVQAPTTGAL